MRPKGFWDRKKSASPSVDFSIAKHRRIRAGRRSGEDGPPPEHLLPRQAAMRRPDKCAELRRDIARRFAESRGRYGCRRIWLGMRSSGTTVSEKAVRRIMAEEGLVARCIGKGMRYSSCGGGITEAPPNILARELRAPAPNTRRVTDIAEMRAADGKARLSAVIDLFDGMIAARGVSRSPTRFWPTRCRGGPSPRCPREPGRSPALTGACITAGTGGSTSWAGTAR